MAKELWRAASACVMVVVCAAGTGVLDANGGATRQHVGRGSVSAGRVHSVMATPDGRVSAWGGGGRGQIGDDGLVDRWVPTLVPNLEGIVQVSAGAAHTMAVTVNGDVYAWGANGFGRLGDGTVKRRPRPVPVPGIENVTMVAAGRAHTLALTADGRVFAWGRNSEGQLGIGNRKTSLVPVHVRDLPAVAMVAAGDAHSLVVTRGGRIYAWGSNQASRLGDGTTKDRLRPVALGLSDVVSVSGGAAHSLALLRDGSVFSWGRGANGELGTGSTRTASRPALVAGLKATAIAAGRRFSAAIRDDGSVAAWGANESGQLGDGTTTRRLRPVAVHGVTAAASIAAGDAHAMAVTASGDVSTWGAGDKGQLGNGSIADRPLAVEILSDIPDWGLEPGEEEEPADSIPPSITASTMPPLGAGWMTTPVTVSFQCADNVAIASCSAPVVVSADGAQSITGTAIDAAGNQSTATVLVSLDLSAPVLTIAAPQDLATTEGEAIEVTGQLGDLASGVADARCNGDPLPIVDGRVRCVVQLRPGRNEIILHATDVVGHQASAVVSVTRIGTASAMVLTPAARAMIVTEEATLSLRDDFGAIVDRAAWSTSDDAVVTLSGSDPPVLTALGVGSVTITAEKDGLIATASVDVSAGLAAGATRWTVAPLPGLTAGTPLFANRVDASGPHLFTVESDQDENATLRAVSADGEVLWQQHAPGVPWMGDAFGGVLAGVYDVNYDFRAYLRLGRGSIQPWRFESKGRLERPAQAPDGTLYGIERLPGGVNIDGDLVWDKYAIVLDGAEGRLISRTLLQREVDAFVADLDGQVLGENPPLRCRSLYYDWAPDTAGPVVGSDGRGYMVVRRHQLHKRGDCIQPFQRRADRAITMGIDLVILSPDAAPQTVNLFSTTCVAALNTTFPCDFPVRAFQVMPDGIGGTLVTWHRATHMVGQHVFVQRSMTRVSAEGDLTEHLVSPRFWLEMIGQAGTAFTFDDGWRAMEVTTGAIKWASPLTNLTPLAARPDGGLASYDWSTGELRITGANADDESRQPFDLDWRAVQHEGDWIGLRRGALTAVVGDFADATRWSALRGNAQGQLSFRRAGIGISLKSQRAKEPLPIYHTAIKIAPINQSWLESWYASHPELAPLRDLFGNLYIMLGAGLPDGQDTASNCFIPGLDTLVSGTNRAGDVDKVAFGRADLPVGERDEATVIQRLLAWHERYSNNAPYACFPEDLTGFYNSNSYVRSLLIHARVPHDPRAPINPSPGWKTIIPSTFFPQR